MQNPEFRFEQGERKAYEQYLNGDIRVDGWKSDWRRSVEWKRATAAWVEAICALGRKHEFDAIA